jgi:hypothetical protein
LASSAGIVTVTAVAASDIDIEFEGAGVTDLGGGLATFDITLSNVTLGITASGISYTTKTYSFVFSK